MVLTKKLWKFWGGLNSGRIDWNFLDAAEWVKEEKDKAVGMLVLRGFVKSSDEFTFPHVQGLWEVVYEKNMNPVYDGKRLDFTAEKYARAYAKYLSSSKKISGYCSVREA